MHFGAPTHASSLVRENHFVKWLDSISEDVAVLYLVGDIFDAWFDYKRVVPRGYVRFLGKFLFLEVKSLARPEQLRHKDADDGDKTKQNNAIEFVDFHGC